MDNTKLNKGIDLPGGVVDFRTDLIFDDKPFPKSAFISHTAADDEFYKEFIFPILERAEISSFYLDYKLSSKSPSIGEAYKKTITQQIQRLNWFLVIQSENAILSKWVQFEVEHALTVKNLDSILVVVRNKCDTSLLNPNLKSVLTFDFSINVQKAQVELENLFALSN